MKITAKTKICMSIGDPISHSLSPVMFNAGFQKLGIDDQFVYVASNVKANNIADFIKGVRAMRIRGISVTIPHKTEIVHYLDKVDDVAKKIGAVNTIVNENGILKGYNTDWIGAVTSLEKITDLKDKKVAVFGAGGAARAIVYGLIQKGAKVTIFNRTIEKAEELAKEFGADVLLDDQLVEIENMEIIINTTPVGMLNELNQSPLNKDLITPNHVVFDAIYNPYETRLLKDAKEQGAQIIHGAEMFLQQGISQFKLYTGHDAPEEAMRDALLSELKK